MTGPWQPRTCSHPIYAWTLTGVHQAVCIHRMWIQANEWDSCYHNLDLYCQPGGALPLLSTQHTVVQSIAGVKVKTFQYHRVSLHCLRQLRQQLYAGTWHQCCYPFGLQWLKQVSQYFRDIIAISNSHGPHTKQLCTTDGTKVTKYAKYCSSSLLGYHNWWISFGTVQHLVCLEETIAVNQ